jgi:nucleoside-diphosphate-sugar epimerase
MKVLVTGGASYLTSILNRKLLDWEEDGKKVITKLIAVDNLYRGQNTIADFCMDDRFEFIRADIIECQDLMDDLYREADLIIPAAALVGMGICARFPSRAWGVNYGIIQDMMLQLQGLKKRVIYANSISGYGKSDENGELDETAEIKPISVYGMSKMRGEVAILEGGGVSLRLSTLFGPSPCMRLDLLVNNFTFDAYTRRNIVLFEQHSKRAYLHVSDAADAFIFAIKNYDKMKGEAYNVTMSNGNLTKRQLAEEIAKQTECHIVEAEFAKDLDSRNYFVTDKKLRALGWKSDYSLEDGIKQLLRFYRGIDVKSANVFADNWVI